MTSTSRSARPTRTLTVTVTLCRWENVHFVDVIASGVRHALVTFFMTRPAWAIDGPDDVRGPVDPHDVALALLQYVLSPESDEDEGQFTMLWHSIFAAPLAGQYHGK